MRKISSQREMILAFIARSAAHPTAREIYGGLKPAHPSLSLGNTYRNLKILVEEGRVVLHQFADGIERYDAVTSVHYHFICITCGRVSDFNMPFQEHVEKEAQRHTRERILGHTIQFTGLCAACAAKEKNHG